MKLWTFSLIIVSCSAARLNYPNSRSRAAKNGRYNRNTSSSAPAVSIHLAPVSNIRHVESLFAMSMPKSSYDVPLKTVTELFIQRTQKPRLTTGQYNQQGFKISDTQHNMRAEILKRRIPSYSHQTQQNMRDIQTGNLQSARWPPKVDQRSTTSPQFGHQQSNRNNQNLNRQSNRGSQNGNRGVQQGPSTNHQHLGAEFEGPRRPPSFDSKTGYHY